MRESSPIWNGCAACCRRRVFLKRATAGVAGLALLELLGLKSLAVAASASREPKLVKIIEFSDSGERGQKLSVPTITKTEEEWRKQLSPDAFAVTRQAATERPYTGEYLNVHDKGIFRCICCDTALFSSATKFESHTGWPSFWEPIAKENVLEFADNSLGMQRIAVSCRRCEAHLGHVFDDGPRPTGLRYCMNSVALRFAKA
jgi:peptide-methionine (R)-S-oxide reductase